MSKHQKPVDLKDLKQAAEGRWAEIVPAIGGLSTDLLNGRHHPCPKCGGHDRFSVFKNFNETGGMLCRQCFHEKNGDGIAALQWLRGWTFKEATAELAAFLGVEFKGKDKRKKRSEPDPTFASPYAAIRYTLTNLSTGHPANKGARFAAAWKYDTFVVLRFDLPTPLGEKQRKTFRPLTTKALSDGRTAYRFGYPPGKRPLYRRAKLEAATDTSLAVVVGGEKAVDAAASLGLVATTCAGGEKAIEQTDWTPLTRFAQVVISVDNDPAGEEYGQKVARQLTTVCRASVKVLHLPNLPERGDIVEWIAGGGTKEAFVQLVASEAAAPPDALAADRKLCEALKIDVLGELPDRRIKVFSEHHGKSVTIDRISILGYPDALQMFGPIVREKIAPRGGEIPPGMYSLDRLKEAIAVVAGTERAGQSVECGQGVWLGEDGVVVLVGAGQAAVWDGERLEVVRRPRVAGLKIDMDVPADQQWYQADQLAERLKQAADREWVDAVITEAGDLFSQWYWRSTTQTAADLITALVLASWVQTAWSWRPLVSITGGSDSGKTTLFEAIESLFGPLGLLSSKSSEAGIRQAVGHHAKVILCDEFESDRHRKAILELFRTCSKGSRTLRGVSGGHGGRSFGLQHVAWVTAVEIELARAPDRNRFISLELGAVPAAKRGKLNMPSEAALAALGQQLLALAVRHVVQGERMAIRLKAREFPGVHGRVVESFATPIGMLAATGGMDEDQAAGLMADLFARLEQDPTQATKDETDLLGEILGSHVDLGHGNRATVGQILARPNSYTDGWMALDRIGVTAVADRPGADAMVNEHYRKSIFFATKGMKRYLLKQTQWEGQAVDQILCRLPGAKKSRQRASGHLPWGVVVPWLLIRDKYLSDDEMF